MKKHTKIYTKYFEIGEQDTPRCEICSNKAVDVHHIEPRGMGGSNQKDVIENLMGLCRSCHDKCESGEIPRETQKEIHNSKL